MVAPNRCRIRICEILRGAFSFETEKPEEAKKYLLTILMEQVHGKYGSLWTFHHETATLHLGATTTRANILHSAILPADTPAGDGMYAPEGYAHFTDVGQETRYRDRRLIDEFGLTHMYSFRLGPTPQRPNGVVCLYPNEAMTQTEAHEFAEICKVAYSPVAFSIDRLRLALINEIGLLVAQKDDVGSFLFKTLDVIRSRLPMEGASIFLWDAQNDRFRLSKSTDLRTDADAKRIRYRSSDPYFQDIVTGRTLLLHQDRALDLYRRTDGPEKVRESGYYTVALVPIKDSLSEGRIIGFMRFANEVNRVKPSDPDYFSEADRRIFEDCAAAVASGLHYYHEKQRVKQMFAFFLHEAGDPIQGIEAKCERMLNPTLFRETETQRSIHVEDIERYKEVLKELLIQYSVLGVDQLDVHIDDKPAHILQNILVPCIKAAIHEVKKRKLRTRLDDGKTHSIHYEAGEFSQLLTVDQVRIRQVFSNLLKNAVKYHNNNKALFEIGIYYRQIIEGYHGILVCDTGMGIRQEIRDRVFEKDFRSPEARRRDVFGTGLGLHLVKAYVEKHGGKVRLLTRAEMTQFDIPAQFVTGFLVELPMNLTRR